MQQKSKEEIINILLNNEHGSLESDGTVSKAGMIFRNQYPDIADKITSQYRSQPTSEEYKLETGDGYGTTYGASQPPASGGYSLEDMKNAYDSGVTEGSNQSGSFEWGIRRKDIEFKEWLASEYPTQS